MGETSDSTQQRAALMIAAGIIAVALVGLQASGAISTPAFTAIASFTGALVVALCVLKAVMPLLSSNRR